MNLKSKNRLLRRINVLLISILLDSVLCLAEGNFPNYFLELHQHYQGNHPSLAAGGAAAGAPEESSTEVQESIEKAMSSILKRLQVLSVQEGEFSRMGFFKNLDAKVKHVDPGAHVYVSGGVVRSLLSYIYSEIHKAHINKNSRDRRTSWKITQDTLKLIAEKQKGIVPLKALGIGSDLDILIKPSTPEKYETARKEALHFIDSARKKIGFRDDDESKINYSIVPYADIGNYDEHISESVSQGGSSLDWLAFPVAGNASHIIQPPGHSQIVEKFIHGTFDYLPPTAETKTKAKQTVRGLRPYVEFPFIKASSGCNGEDQLASELKMLADDVA